ncbi:MAG TPA: hypothetical protein ENK73_05965 [Thiomicrospira sp.]|nr:hypothetical protein [Thiomicrospira sp.]
MKNVLLTTLFSGLLSANIATANTNVESVNITPKTSAETQQQIQEVTPSFKENSETKVDMIQSKAKGQTIHLAAAEKVENCWGWDACLNNPQSNDDGYDTYAFN